MYVKNSSQPILTCLKWTIWSPVNIFLLVFWMWSKWGSAGWFDASWRSEDTTRRDLQLILDRTMLVCVAWSICSLQSSNSTLPSVLWLHLLVPSSHYTLPCRTRRLARTKPWLTKDHRLPSSNASGATLAASPVPTPCQLGLRAEPVSPAARGWLNFFDSFLPAGLALCLKIFCQAKTLANATVQTERQCVYVCVCVKTKERR